MTTKSLELPEHTFDYTDATGSGQRSPHKEPRTDGGLCMGATVVATTMRSAIPIVGHHGHVMGSQ